MDNLDSRIALVRRLQAATHKLTSRSARYCKASSLVRAGAIAGCVSGLFGVASNSSYPEKEKFVSTGPIASRDLRLSRTDKCNFSIMMALLCHFRLSTKPQFIDTPSYSVGSMCVHA